jgi:hypothetical protein
MRRLLSGTLPSGQTDHFNSMLVAVFKLQLKTVVFRGTRWYLCHACDS